MSINTKQIFLQLFILIFFYSCSDKCKDKACFNGGVCVDEKCECPPDYYGTECQYKVNNDLCDDVNCQNGGVCDDGTCDCPEGYTGTYCQNEVYDPCDGVNCQNGGVCNDGTCDCPNGYTGTYCQNYDECYSITCYNNGTCYNGICNCPEGYAGTYCQDIQTPISVKIERIEVESFSLTDESGNPADESSLPDLYFRVLRNDIEIGVSCYIENANPNDNNIIGIGCPIMPIIIDSPKANNTVIKIRSYDYDFGSSDDEYLGGYFFDFDNDNFPETKTIYNPAAWHNLKVILHLDWVF